MSRRLLGLCAAAYLSVQLIVPWLVIARSGPTQRDFSWDMFSFALSCSHLAVVVRAEGGAFERLPLDAEFKSWAQLRRALSLERFERYAQGVCERRMRESARPVQLYLISECRKDRGQSSFHLVDPERDFCKPR